MEKTNKYKDSKYIAVYTAFIAGIAINLFGLVNVLHNSDDIYYQPSGFGVGISSGRWFLEILGRVANKLAFDYNLPWFYGVIFILLVSISCYFIVDIFKITNKLLAAITGCIFISFPTITATLNFRYTVPYYGLSILLAILASWMLVRSKGKLIIRTILFAVFTSLSLGIYQAYLPLTISILVLYLIKETLLDKYSWKYILSTGIYFILSIILALVLYFVLLKVFLLIFNAELGSYRGIDKIGQFSIRELPTLILNMFEIFFMIPIKNVYGIAPTPLISFSYILISFLNIIMAVVTAITKKLKGMSIFMLLLLVITFPASINLIVFMSKLDIEIYTTLMIYSFTIFLISPLVIAQTLPDKSTIKYKKVVSYTIVFLLSTLTINFAYFSNLNYTGLYYAKCQTENYIVSLITQIRMTEGFTTDKKWAFIGYINDPLLESSWQNIPKYATGYADITSNYFLLSSEANGNWAKTYLGYDIPFESEDRVEDIKKLKEVTEMPCWPNEGSIKIIDNTVVVKFQ